MNKQYRNVGNLGDVTKHAALVRLALAFRPRLYVESHAFLLEAPCPDPDRWLRETAAELANHPGYLDYFRLEYGIVSGAPYRCSTRLVLDALAPEVPELLLAEADPETRARLAEDLERAGVSLHRILTDARDLAGAEIRGPGGSALALVDPFVLDRATWGAIGVALLGIARRAERFAVLLFTYDEASEKVGWREAPLPLGAPVAFLHRRPFHLALYATPAGTRMATDAVRELGWTAR